MREADVILYALNPLQYMLLGTAREVIRRERVNVLAHALEAGIHFLLKHGEASIHFREALVVAVEALINPIETLLNALETLINFIKSSRNHCGEIFNVFVFKRRCHGGKCTLPLAPVK